MAIGFGGALPAQAKIYVTTGAGVAIDVVDLDGANTAVLIPTVAANTGPVTVGFDGYIYWASYDTSVIGRARIDGSDSQPGWFTGAAQPSGVAVSATHIYWSEDGNGRVSRAKLDGTDIEPDLVTGLTSPHGLAIDDENLYIADTSNGRILQAPLDGGTVTELVAGIAGPQMVAVNSDHVFWTNMGTSTVGRARLDGMGPANENFIVPSPAGWTYGISADDTYVYWTNYTGAHAIGRANVDGTDDDVDFVSGFTYPSGLAVVPNPKISSITPATGTPAGGTRIEIAGSGFFQEAQINIGGQTCEQVQWLSSSRIACTTPAAALGAVNVTLTNPDTQSVSRADGFTYATPPPTPNQKQTPRNGCVVQPTKVPVNGRRTLLKAHCKTTAGQPVRVRVADSRRGATTRGDLRGFRVIRKANGKVILRTYGLSQRLKVIWSAPATAGYDAYRSVRTYRT